MRVNMALRNGFFDSKRESMMSSTELDRCGGGTETRASGESLAGGETNL